MKIAIVGNGCSALNNKNGKFIDSCDLVVRIKNFEIVGYEEFIGSKIDWYSSKWFSWFNRVTHKPLEQSFTHNITTCMFMFFDPEIQYKNLSVYGEYVSLYADLQLKNEFPSTVGTSELHYHYIALFNLINKKIIYYTPEEIHQLAINKLKIHKQKYMREDLPGQALIEPTVGIRTIFKMKTLFPQDEIFITGFDGFTTSWYWNPKHKINNAHNYLNERIYLKTIIKTKQVYNLDE